MSARGYRRSFELNRGVALVAAFMIVMPVLLYSDAVGAQAPTRRAVAEHYAAMVYATYEDSLASAKTMRQAVNAFIAKPGSATLQAAKTSWLAAREWYGQTEAFRFYGGPIDDVDGAEPRINSWPVDESYIDSV